MPRRVALVHMPGWPLGEERFLLPGNMLFAAGLLQAADMDVRVLDYSHPEALTRPAAAWQALRAETTWWKRRQASRDFDRILNEWRDAIIEDIVAWGADTILFFADDAPSGKQVRHAADTARKRLPHVQLFACGPGMPMTGTPWIPWQASDFLVSQEAPLAKFGDMDLAEIDLPASLYDSGKFNILPVAPARSGFHGSWDTPAFRGQLTGHLTRHRPGTAIWLEEPTTPRELFELSDRTVLRHPAPIAMVARPRAGISPALANLLRGSGCLVIEIDALTGSQRLLEDVYGVDFSVRDIRDLARTCREAGIRIVLRFSAPCCWDDRHTFAECERLAEQCGCVGVSVAGAESHDSSVGIPGVPSPVDLERHLEAAGIPTGLRGWHIVAATAAGYAGREHRWIRQFRQHLLEGDLESVKSWITTCNRGLSHLSSATDSAVTSRLHAVAN
ncbi:MAG TPA: hypothetical protein PK349_03680 [Candidatus Hydrogenedentes bacterium]|nr:hypothetical protein [Candidatus Hydrogenedentota bacterium]